jgi:hypothetical protein
MLFHVLELHFIKCSCVVCGEDWYIGTCYGDGNMRDEMYTHMHYLAYIFIFSALLAAALLV